MNEREEPDPAAPETPGASEPGRERIIDLGGLVRERAADPEGDPPAAASGWPNLDAPDTNKQGRSTFNPMYDVSEHPTHAVQLQPGGLGCARIAVAVPLVVGAISRLFSRRNQR